MRQYQHLRIEPPQPLRPDGFSDLSQRRSRIPPCLSARGVPRETQIQTLPLLGENPQPQPNGSQTSGVKTIPTDSSEAAQSRSAFLRRFGIVVLVVFVIASCFLGVRSRSAEETSDQLHVSVTYPTIGRRGLATPLTFRVTVDGGGLITIWINNSYLGQVDHNNWVPEPTEVLGRGAETGHVFKPEGEFLEIHLDTRFAPSVPPGRLPLEVKVEAGTESIQFQLSTWVVP